MYELSLGNIDMACRIYCEAQQLVIGTGDENITSAVLEYAYPVACSLSSRTNEVIEARQNLILPSRILLLRFLRQSLVSQELLVIIIEHTILNLR